MWKILIVDDEAIIRESLKRFIDWQSINATVCGLAENGSAALDFILSDTPDIILCDISMPSLNGIELIEFLHHHQIPSEIIFISAYSSFEYARAALKYGAFDYILKPLEESLILDCVKRCIQKIEEHNVQTNLLQNIDKEHFEKLHSLLLHCLSDYQYQIADTDLKFLQSQGFLSDEFPYVAAIASPKILPQEILENSDNMHSFIIHMDNNWSIMLLSLASIEPEDMKTFDTLGKNIRILCEPTPVYLRSPILHGQKISSLSSELFLCRVFSVASFARLCEKADNLNFDFNLKEMSEIVKTSELDKLDRLVNEMFLFFLRENLIYDLDLLKLKCIEFIDYVLSDLEEHQLYTYLMTDSLTSKKNINAQRELCKIYDITKNILRNLASCFTHLRENSSSFLVRSALEYIHKHYGNDISLTALAKHLYISPAYLSKIFKAERNQTFSNYVLDYRIKMAKEYLKDPQYKIYQIAQMCGFSDVAHFSKCFKQVTQLSPNRYRNQL